MARTPPAPVSPALLTWARESLNLSREEAARKVGVPTEVLDAWESNEDAPSVAQLRKLARVYKRPLAVFFLPEPPTEFLPLRDFRRPLGTHDRPWTSDLILVMRRVREQQEAVVELRRLVGDPTPDRPSIGTFDDVERFAAAARQILNVSLHEQWAWADKYQALNAWINALEQLGILVLQTRDVGMPEMRGFSLDHETVPAIVLNGSDSVRGRIFTAMHELSHVLLRAPGVCDLHDTVDRPDARDDIERFCNQAAAVMLMPSEALEREPELAHPPRDGRWSDTVLYALAERYSVSQEALLRRLVSLGYATWEYYLERRANYEEAYRAARDAGKNQRPPFARIVVRDLGRAYVRLVLDAYHGQRINTSDVSDYLGVKVRHIEKLQAEAFRAPAGA